MKYEVKKQYNTWVQVFTTEHMDKTYPDYFKAIPVVNKSWLDGKIELNIEVSPVMDRDEFIETIIKPFMEAKALNRSISLPKIPPVKKITPIEAAPGQVRPYKKVIQFIYNGSMSRKEWKVTQIGGNDMVWLRDERGITQSRPKNDFGKFKPFNGNDEHFTCFVPEDIQDMFVLEIALHFYKLGLEHGLKGKQHVQ